MLYLQKGNFQKVVRWVAGGWMTANQATLLGCVCVVLTAVCFYAGLTVPGARWAIMCVPVFLVLRMAMNALDGMLAREYGTGSVSGEIWNEALDIIGDTVCYGILLFVPGFPVRPVVLLLILSWAAEYFGVLGKGMPGGVRRHETVLGGKPDRAVWMGLMALLLFFVPGFERVAGYYILLVCCFVLLTSVLRVRKIMGEARGKDYQSYTWIGR